MRDPNKWEVPWESETLAEWTGDVYRMIFGDIPIPEGKFRYPYQSRTWYKWYVLSLVDIEDLKEQIN